MEYEIDLRNCEAARFALGKIPWRFVRFKVVPQGRSITFKMSRLRSSRSSTFNVIRLPQSEMAEPDLTSLSR